MERLGYSKFARVWFLSEVLCGTWRCWPDCAGGIENLLAFMDVCRNLKHLPYIMKTRKLKSTIHRQGFTLVELLVVIVIVASLAALITMVAQAALAKAASSKALSNLRQSGTIFLASATEKNGKMQFTDDAGGSDLSLLPYNVVRQELGLRWGSSGETGQPQICEIMHWNFEKVKPKKYEENCFGVNFTNLPDSENLDEWTVDEVTKVKTLVLARISRPGAYPFLLDSSNSTGDEYFQILDSGSGAVGLRNSGKANAYFLDGSARSLDRADLKKAGFTKAYDNKTTPPKSVTL